MNIIHVVGKTASFSVLDEVWLPIIGYLEYEVSNFGMVRSCKPRFQGHPYIMKTILHRDGYVRIGLSVEGKFKNPQVHRLVATAFIPNPKNKPQVNHLDGNKTNNHVRNLEWSTASENRFHAYASGLQDRGKGSKNVSAVLNETDIIAIRKLFDQGVRNVEIGKIFGVNRRTISAIKHGRTWTHI